MVKIEHNVRYQGRPSQVEMERRWRLARKFMQERGLDYLVTQANEGVLCQYVRCLPRCVPALHLPAVRQRRGYDHDQPWRSRRQSRALGSWSYQ